MSRSVILSKISWNTYLCDHKGPSPTLWTCCHRSQPSYHAQHITLSLTPSPSPHNVSPPISSNSNLVARLIFDCSKQRQGPTIETSSVSHPTSLVSAVTFVHLIRSPQCVLALNIGLFPIQSYHWMFPYDAFSHVVSEEYILICSPARPLIPLPDTCVE